jgi:hypothetical protein
VIALTDLESEPCPSGLIERHLPGGPHRDFVLRIAERTLESWLLADSAALAKFLRISEALVPSDPEAPAKPKQTLVNLARRSPVRVLREDLVPQQDSRGLVGRGYTPRMTEFITKYWRPLEASRRSQSLRKALSAIRGAVTR